MAGAAPADLVRGAMEAWERLAGAGEGATSVVFRARGIRSGELGALKIAKPGAPAAVEALAREAKLLARVERRWGPRLLDAGPGVLVTEWVAGETLQADAGAERDPGRSERRSALLAHALGRALEELHEAGIRHGDVKPENVLLTRREPRSDDAAERAATLVDLGLATSFDGEPLGGTPRYAAPELRERGEAGPAADLWALGALLAELLDPALARAPDLAAAIGRGALDAAHGEPARWVRALLAASPGGRPSAAWVAERAARFLGLQRDARVVVQARVDRVRRTYLVERERDIRPGAAVSPAIEGPAAAWLGSAIAWATRLAEGPLETRDAAIARRLVEPLADVRRARWLVSLVGPGAASWPIAADPRPEGDLAARAVALCAERDPSAWTVEDWLGREGGHPSGWDPGEGADRTARLVRELARSTPDPRALAMAEDDVASGRSCATLACELASALLRIGEAGRAWAALVDVSGDEAAALRAEVARRRGDRATSEGAARQASRSDRSPCRWRGQAVLARLAWDGGDLARAEAHLEDARGAAAAEVGALVAWRRGAVELGLALVARGLAEAADGDAEARLHAVRGLLELSRGQAVAAAEAFRQAVDRAARAGAVVEEATYLTNLAAASADAGDVATALASATRSALLWERLGRPAQAARAWLDRASSLVTVGAVHAADEAAAEARARALASRDVQAAAFARLAQAEVRPPGDPQARAYALQADDLLRAAAAADGAALAASVDDRARAAARLLVWAADRIDDLRLAEIDETVAGLPPVTRWEWWGARAAAVLQGRTGERDGLVLPALVALADVPAPLGARGPALDAAARLATQRGRGDVARRFEDLRAVAARTLREGTPPELRTFLSGVPWARASIAVADGVAFAPAQVEQLEAIVRALSTRDRLRPLLDQVLGTMILWAGVERGLLLLRAPDGRLVPRAARNLAGRNLTGDELVLSQTIARRALEAGEAVVATDAFSTLGDLHASVHALKLRSVLALPLVARGEPLGVVYLDDRGRKGAFGPQELAWVRVVASQAAVAIADARDAVLLRRAVLRAERSRRRVEALLQDREAELDVTRTQLALAQSGTAGAGATRFAYDDIAGRSAPMQDLLRLLDKVTASDVPVLIVGESGTGKELVARAMHKNGRRSRRAFVSENCASVPETLLESTLFGHVKGAFTGASSTRPGLFDVANGGTLLLDEIGEMSLAMQAKLLRVLQEGEVRPVGSERARTVDVRILAATHRDLAAMVAAGKFREDLFYRLNVITLRVPPLRERSEDIPLLVDHFVRKHGRAQEADGTASAAGRPEAAVPGSPRAPAPAGAAARVPPRVTRAAMAKLVAYPWPGNVRQLENEVRRALVLGEGEIDVPQLSEDVVRGGPPSSRGATGLDLRARVDALEADLVQDALAKTRGNQTRAAQLLGVSRFGLQKMMKRLRITPST